MGKAKTINHSNYNEAITFDKKRHSKKLLKSIIIKAQQQSISNGTDEITMDEINEIIKESRKTTDSTK